MSRGERREPSAEELEWLESLPDPLPDDFFDQKLTMRKLWLMEEWNGLSDRQREQLKGYTREIAAPLRALAQSPAFRRLDDQMKRVSAAQSSLDRRPPPPPSWLESTNITNIAKHEAERRARAEKAAADTVAILGSVRDVLAEQTVAAVRAQRVQYAILGFTLAAFTVGGVSVAIGAGVPWDWAIGGGALFLVAAAIVLLALLRRR